MKNKKILVIEDSEYLPDEIVITWEGGNVIYETHYAKKKELSSPEQKKKDSQQPNKSKDSPDVICPPHHQFMTWIYK